MTSNNLRDAHSNNFDFIRIFAALTVLYSHHFYLTGRVVPSVMGIETYGGAAVMVFFIVSGYLVTSSWYHDPNIIRFAWRRILRIWPALTLVVVCTVFILGPVVTNLSLSEYFSHGSTYDYFYNLRMNVVFLLPGVFETNPAPLSVNGSLWTIPLEVQCYVVLAFAGLFGLLRSKFIFVAFVAIYMVWFILRSSADLYGVIHYPRELGAYFLAGAGLFALKDYWRRCPWITLLVCMLIACLLWISGWRYLASWVLLPYAVIFFGVNSTPIIKSFGKWGDPSYGIYLIAFPVQQTVIKYLWPIWGFWGTMALSTLITIFLAFLSWNFVEKWFLKFKPKKKIIK
ncbi:acyltransferase [Lampropedia aestuarii]|nr:acyltransferase [Lampropedia aestuarii]